MPCPYRAFPRSTVDRFGAGLEPGDPRRITLAAVQSVSSPAIPGGSRCPRSGLSGARRSHADHAGLLSSLPRAWDRHASTQLRVG